MDSSADKVRHFLRERGWDKLRPADVAKSVMIEGAELLEIFQWENLSLDEVKNDPEKMSAIKKELADVLICSLEMAVLLDLNTDEIIAAKLETTSQKYPADMMRQGTQGATDDKKYWEIKNQHRNRDS